MNDEVSEFMIAGIVGLGGWFFGGLDGYIRVLVAFTVIDYITGILRAGAESKLSRAVAFKGVAKKIVMFFLVGIANIIDVHLLDGKLAFKVAITLFYIGNEGISIIDNADKLGVPIPKFLRGRFLEFMKKNQQEAEEQTAS